MKNKQEAIDFLEKLESRIKALEEGQGSQDSEELQELRKEVAELKRQMDQKSKGILDHVADLIFGSEEEQEA